MVGCTICGSGRTEEHHTSYFPEETVVVCRSCHMKIHRKDGFRDDLEPDRSRPEDYEKKLKMYNAKANPNKRACSECGSGYVKADLYPVEGGGDFPKQSQGAVCYTCVE